MAIDFNLPILTTLKTTFTTYIVDNIKAVAKMDFTGAVNIPDGCIRWNDTDSKFEKYTSATTSWGDLSSSYDMSVSLATAAGTLSGMGSSVTELDTAADGIANPPLAGDATPGRVLRMARMTITGGTGDAINVTVTSKFNGDAITIVSDILSNGTAKSGITYYELATFPYSNIILNSSLLTGNAIFDACFGFVSYNTTGARMNVQVVESVNGLRFTLSGVPYAADWRLGDALDISGGLVQIDYVYITDA